MDGRAVVKVHALLSWFDEDPDMLYDAVVSHADHCDQVIALDGRYALYPASRDESSGEEYDAIGDACRDTRTPFVIEAPAGPWDGRWGGEVAKRAHLFALAERRSKPDDWYWIFDGDFVVRDAAYGWRDRLAETPRFAADVELVERRRRIPHPVLFRAVRGLTVSTVHWRYHVPGGPELWGPLAPRPAALNEDIVVEHRDHERARARSAQRRRYYQVRDRRRIERPDPETLAEMRDQAQARKAHMTRLFDVVAGRAAVSS